MDEVKQFVTYYAKSLKSHLDNPSKVSDEKVLHALKKLAKVRMSTALLQESGVGRYVKLFSKKDGEIGEQARNLITTWKQLVHKENPSSHHSSKAVHKSSSKSSEKSKKEKHIPISEVKIKQEPVDNVVVKTEQLSGDSEYQYQRQDSFAMLTDHLSHLKNNLMNDIQREAREISETIKQEKPNGSAASTSESFDDSISQSEAHGNLAEADFETAKSVESDRHKTHHKDSHRDKHKSKDSGKSNHKERSGHKHKHSHHRNRKESDGHNDTDVQRLNEHKDESHRKEKERHSVDKKHNHQTDRHQKSVDNVTDKSDADRHRKTSKEAHYKHSEHKSHRHKEARVHKDSHSEKGEKGSQKYGESGDKKNSHKHTNNGEHESTHKHTNNGEHESTHKHRDSSDHKSSHKHRESSEHTSSHKHRESSEHKSGHKHRESSEHKSSHGHKESSEKKTDHTKHRSSKGHNRDDKERLQHRDHTSRHIQPIASPSTLSKSLDSDTQNDVCDDAEQWGDTGGNMYCDDPDLGSNEFDMESAQSGAGAGGGDLFASPQEVSRTDDMLAELRDAVMSVKDEEGDDAMFRYSAREFDVQCSYGNDGEEEDTVGGRLTQSSRSHDVIRDVYRQKWEEKVKREQEMRQKQQHEKQARVKKSLKQYLEEKKRPKPSSSDARVNMENVGQASVKTEHVGQARVKTEHVGHDRVKIEDVRHMDAEFNLQRVKTEPDDRKLSKHHHHKKKQKSHSMSDSEPEVTMDSRELRKYRNILSSSKHRHETESTASKKHSHSDNRDISEHQTVNNEMPHAEKHRSKRGHDVKKHGHHSDNVVPAEKKHKHSHRERDSHREAHGSEKSENRSEADRSKHHSSEHRSKDRHHHKTHGKEKNREEKIKVKEEKRESPGVKRKEMISDLEESVCGDDDWGENDGGAFLSDMASYDTALIQKAKRKKTEHTKPEKAEEKRKEHKSSSRSKEKHKSSHREKEHKSKHRHRSKDRRESNDVNSVMNVPKPKELSLSQADILATLPEINPDYRPLHLPSVSVSNQKAMDFVDVGDGFKKKGRTQVFSGRKKQPILEETPTLYQACMKVLCENIEALDVVGECVPYFIFKPVLERCTPIQLYNLEDLNQHFICDTDELWESHCKRDFKGSKPGEFESWREHYLTKHDEREEKLKKLTSSICTNIQTAVPVRKAKLAYVDGPVKPPRNMRRAQARFGTAGSSKPMSPRSRRHEVIRNAHTGPDVRNREKVPIPREAMQHHGRTKKPVKVIAPMMAKSLKFMRGLRR